MTRSLPKDVKMDIKGRLKRDACYRIQSLGTHLI